MGRSWKPLLVFGLLVFSISALAACAGAASPNPSTIIAPSEKPSKPSVPTKAPAATQAPGTPVAAPGTATAVSQPTQLAPTPSGPTATPLVEARVVELEWPSSMRLGDSDVIRLSLIPSKDGYTVTTEFPEHQTQSQDLPVNRPGGFEIRAVARLDGVGFKISPQGEQERSLPLDETVTYRWSIKPDDAGHHRVSVTLLLRWIPALGTNGSQRESSVYSRSMDVIVTSFFGLDRGQAMAGGFFGLIFGGGLGIFGLVSLILLPGRPALKSLKPNPSLRVEPRPGLALSADENTLLRAIFSRYGRLVLESEFLSGYSGARTFLALPIRTDGRADAYTIVKIGAREDIRREFENYEKHVKDTLPPVTARIQHPPVTTAPADLFGRGSAALQYTFIAEPGRTPTSLRQALQEKPDPGLLVKLFETFGPNWWMQRKPYTFRLGQEYDCMLPTHLVIEPASGRGTVLEARTSPQQAQFEIGQLVNLRRFRHIEVRPDGKSLSLRGESVYGQSPLRVRWLGLGDPRGATGRVVGTRQTLLREFTQGFDSLGLPDPFEKLSQALNENISGTQSTIHGDLNLENILVGPGDFIWLIDFAQTRDGHTLFDFAHLEAEIIGHIIAPRLTPQGYLDLLKGTPAPEFSALHSLITGLHSISDRCLFNSSQPREYRLALYMACLGALKFVNLDARAKYLLYLTAAYLAK